MVRESFTVSRFKWCSKLGAESNAVRTRRLHVGAIDSGGGCGGRPDESRGIFKILAPQPQVPSAVLKRVGQHQIGLGGCRLIGIGRVIKDFRSEEHTSELQS